MLDLRDDKIGSSGGAPVLCQCRMQGRDDSAVYAATCLFVASLTAEEANRMSGRRTDVSVVDREARSSETAPRVQVSSPGTTYPG